MEHTQTISHDQRTLGRLAQDLERVSKELDVYVEEMDGGDLRPELDCLRISAGEVLGVAGLLREILRR